MISSACYLTKYDVEFLPVKKSKCKQRGFFEHQNYIKKSEWKQRGFFDHRNCAQKSTWKRRGFLNHQTKNVRGNDVGFSINEITSKRYA